MFGALPGAIWTKNNSCRSTLCHACASSPLAAQRSSGRLATHEQSFAGAFFLYQAPSSAHESAAVGLGAGPAVGAGAATAADSQVTATFWP